MTSSPVWSTFMNNLKNDPKPNFMQYLLAYLEKYPNPEPFHIQEIRAFMEEKFSLGNEFDPWILEAEVKKLKEGSSASFSVLQETESALNECDCEYCIGMSVPMEAEVKKK